MDKAPARDGYSVIAGGREVGVVASGSPAPFLKKNIALVYVPIEHSRIGSELFVSVRGRQVPARVVDTPFYKREKKSTEDHGSRKKSETNLSSES